MPPTTTRTFNPLPFEHLEPKRFEDLARQLAYDFKPWRQLEATGRTGSDDGFDARGFEIVPTGGLPAQEDDDELTDEGAADRLWLIQCKRERTIGPTKMRVHLEAIPPESRFDLYGLIFVAACDFSKATRDTIRSWCSANGISECHVWGKAELEDMLYQPKNDNLLFAYFGISLQIRRQRTAVNLRRITTIKRKLRRLIDKDSSGLLHVVVRDPIDERFPSTKGVDFKEGNFLWRVIKTKGLGPFGLRFIEREHFAYLDREKEIWDIATKSNLAVPEDHYNPWYARQVSEDDQQLETEIRHFWLSLSELNMTTAYFIGEIPYEDIIEIDEVGNDVFKLATIFVTFKNGEIPQGRGDFAVIAKYHDLDWGFVPSKDAAHVRIFPDEFRDDKFDRSWAERHELTFSTEKYEVELNPPYWLVELRKQQAEDADKSSSRPPDMPIE